MLALAGLAMALVPPLLNRFSATLVTGLVMAAAIVVDVVVREYGNPLLPLASGLLMIVLLFALNMAYGFFVDARGKRQITGLFGQ